MGRWGGVGVGEVGTRERRVGRVRTPTPRRPLTQLDWGLIELTALTILILICLADLLTGSKTRFWILRGHRRWLMLIQFRPARLRASINRDI